MSLPDDFLALFPSPLADALRKTFEAGAKVRADRQEPPANDALTELERLRGDRLGTLPGHADR